MYIFCARALVDLTSLMRPWPMSFLSAFVTEAACSWVLFWSVRVQMPAVLAASI